MIQKRLLEIEARKKEIRELVADESKEVDVDALNKEVDELTAEETTLNESVEAEVKDEEERKAEKRALAEKLSAGKVEKKEIDKEIKEEKSMEKRSLSEILKGEVYKNAWAKRMMNKPESDFTEEEVAELRAVGDAVTTTATTFVAADSTHNGVNNGGLFIPTTVRTDIMNIIEQQSPFYRDIRKLVVAGNISLPYMSASDDSEWYAEGTSTKNEGQEYKEISLGGHELAKNVVVTWKLEKMAVESFIPYITKEIAKKIAKALVKGVLYGNGTNKPVGAIYGLTAQTGDDPIETIVNTYKALDDEMRIGAKAYISTNVNIDIVGYKDEMGNYPFLNGLAATKLVQIEVEPFLENGDIVCGNPENYTINTQEELSLIKETKATERKTVYGAYEIADGKPVPGAFAKGSYEVETA